MQLNLVFLETPSPGTMLWQTLDENQRLAALEVLARLIAQAARPEAHAEDSHDE